MNISTEIIDYPDKDVTCKGYLAYDSTLNARKGTVLIAHAWEGRNSFVEEKARLLAALGYNGFAVDMYGEGQKGATPEERRALMQPLLDDRRALAKRITAALDAVKADIRTQNTPVVVMGYCFGGICALDLARTGADLAGAVTFHGGLVAPDFPTPGIRTAVLMFHADNDKFVPLEDFLKVREELNAAEVTWQAHVYGQVLHSFTNPEERDPSTGMAYDEYAATHCWDSLVAFLKHIFK